MGKVQVSYLFLVKSSRISSVVVQVRIPAYIKSLGMFSFLSWYFTPRFANYFSSKIPCCS